MTGIFTPECNKVTVKLFGSYIYLCTFVAMNINGKHLHIPVIMTRTTFGHGDSSTEVWAECRDCKAKSQVEWYYGFPATHDNIRKSQSDLMNLPEIK